MNTFRCDNYTNGLTTQPGDQPVRIFYESIGNIFLNIRDELYTMYSTEKIASMWGVYHPENVAVIGPSALINGAQITIHDTFLSFLWCYNYGTLYNFPGYPGKFNKSDANKATFLLGYARRLLEQYVDWDKEEWPNPEIYNKDDWNFIRQTNTMFIVGVNVIMYHEFAHYVLGHIDELQRAGGRVSNTRLIEMEHEADAFAFEKVFEWYKGEWYVLFGLITALTSLMYISSNFNGGDKHPAPHLRIARCLEHLNLPDNHPAWAFASWPLMQWQVEFKTVFGFPSKFENRKRVFYEFIHKIEEFFAEK